MPWANREVEKKSWDLVSPSQRCEGGLDGVDLEETRDRLEANSDNLFPGQHYDDLDVWIGTSWTSNDC